MIIGQPIGYLGRCDLLGKAGWTVQSLASIGDGCPDLLVCSPAGVNHLIEVKVMQTHKLTPAQLKWHSQWQSPVWVLWTEDDVDHICGRG